MRLSQGAMPVAHVSDEKDDRVIRERRFKMGGNIDIGLIPNLVRRNETNEGRRLTIFVRLPDRPGSLAGLVDVCAAQEANVIEVQHIREGVKLHPRETGIQVVLEVKSPAHSEDVTTALESSGFQLR